MVTKTAHATARIASLQSANVFSAPLCEADEELDYLTADAAQLFDAPIAMITLVANDQLLFKSSIGNVQGSQIARKRSFCSVAISRNTTLAVPDTTKDPRFRQFALVTDANGIRAYLGVPLRGNDGSVVGTLCIMDTKPRKFAKQQLHLLNVMATNAEQRIQALHL